MVERPLKVRYVIGSQSLMVDPLSYFSFQLVLHNWCNKNCGMDYPNLWNGAYKIFFAVNLGKNRQWSGGSEFSLVIRVVIHISNTVYL